MIYGLVDNLISYLHFKKPSSGTDTDISISTSGYFKTGFDSAKVDQTIALEQVVDLSGNSTEQQMIDDLMKQQVIQVGH